MAPVSSVKAVSAPSRSSGVEGSGPGQGEVNIIRRPVRLVPSSLRPEEDNDGVAPRVLSAPSPPTATTSSPSSRPPLPLLPDVLLSRSRLTSFLLRGPQCLELEDVTVVPITPPSGCHGTGEVVVPCGAPGSIDADSLSALVLLSRHVAAEGTAVQVTLSGRVCGEFGQWLLSSSCR